MENSFLQKKRIHVTMNTKYPSQLLAQREKKWVPALNETTPVA